MQMSEFHDSPTKNTVKCIACPLKRKIIDACVLNGCNFMTEPCTLVFLSAYTEKVRLFLHYQIISFSGGGGGQGFNSSVAFHNISL